MIKDHSISKNISIHNRIAKIYDSRHAEIFNDVEQSRLRESLLASKAQIRTETAKKNALDFGCGSGNLTRHLLALDFQVTAADVSVDFLRIVDRQFSNIITLLMNGSDLYGIPDEHFDFIAVYSVLHHIPDYLKAIAELARVCKPGGVIFLDHERTEEFWKGDLIYKEFLDYGRRRDWRKYLKLSNYVHKIRRFFNPRHANEGDIHVWPDDHIEWGRIVELLLSKNCKLVLKQHYLLYQPIYRMEVYDQYKDLCSDTCLMVFRKQEASHEAK